MTEKEYNLSVKRLIQIMRDPKLIANRKKELNVLLEKLDAYNGLKFLKNN